MAYVEFLWITKKSLGRKIYFEMVYSTVCARKGKRFSLKIVIDKYQKSAPRLELIIPTTRLSAQPSLTVSEPCNEMGEGSPEKGGKCGLGPHWLSGHSTSPLAKQQFLLYPLPPVPHLGNRMILDNVWY